MVAQITSGASVVGVLNYNGIKVSGGSAEIIYTNGMIVPYGELERLTIPVMMKSFQPYLDANRNTKKPVFHVSLNPHPNDKLTDTDYNLIAHDYMQAMGYGEQPYVVYKHKDIDRTHIHIVSLRVDIEGKKLPHKFEAKKSMNILRELERKYDLTPAIKGVRSLTPLTPGPVDYKYGELIQQIGHKVREVLRKFNFTDFSTFNLILKSQNIIAEPVKGRIRNRNYEGILYHTLDGEGSKTGSPIKASTFGKHVGMKAIKEKIGKGYKMLHYDMEARNRIMSVLDAGLEEATSLKELADEIKRHGIDMARFDKNVSPSITRFIDRETKLIFKGKELDDKYSLKNISESLKQNEGRQKEREAQEINPYYNYKKGRGI